MMKTHAVKKNVTVPVEVAIFHVYYSGGPGRDPLPNDFSTILGNPGSDGRGVRCSRWW